MLLETGTTRFARVTVIVRFSEPRITVSVTLLPASPRISLEPKSADLLASESEPTATITSPRLSPAFDAGESSNTSTTRRPLFSFWTSIPIPLRCGLSWSRNDL